MNNERTTKTMTTPVLAAKAIRDTSVQQDGGTFTATGQPVTEGVAVGVHTIRTAPYLSEGMVEHALGEIQEGNYLGTWWDFETGAWEIQETAIFANREDAIDFAATIGERYVYDITADECIAVE